MGQILLSWSIQVTLLLSMNRLVISSFTCSCILPTSKKTFKLAYKKGTWYGQKSKSLKISQIWTCDLLWWPQPSSLTFLPLSSPQLQNGHAHLSNQAICEWDEICKMPARTGPTVHISTKKKKKKKVKEKG